MKETKAVKKYDPITPENAVLLLIDHQVGTLSFGISDIDPVNLRNNTMWLAQTAKDMKLPVILTTSNAAGANGPLFPELIGMLPGVPIIDRVIINAWHDKQFKDAVKKTGRKHLIMAGVTTDVCLTFPAISAAQEDFDVYAVVDASGTLSMQAFHAALHRMSMFGVQTMNTNAVVAELQADWSNTFAETTAKSYATHVPNFGYIAAHMAQVRTSK